MSVKMSEKTGKMSEIKGLSVCIQNRDAEVDTFHLCAELTTLLRRLINADQAQLDILSALYHFGLGFVEVFVRINDQTANWLAVAYKRLYLGEEGVLELYVSIPFVAILQHKVEDLTKCGLG